MDNATETSRVLVGMDLHSEEIALHVAQWTYGRDPTKIKTLPGVALDDLLRTYKRQIPLGALTIVEATTNAFMVVRELKAIGYEAIVVKSDTLKGMANPDVTNDKIDAVNLTRAYARGFCREVYVPTEVEESWRELVVEYDNAKEDAKRAYNRIWAFCSAHGLKVPTVHRAKTEAGIQKLLDAQVWSPTQQFRLNSLLNDYRYHTDKQAQAHKEIARIVATTPVMQKVMTVLGVGALIAFDIVASIGDIERFDKSRKLVSYIGLNPTVCESGKYESHHHISKRGKGRLRARIIEGAQAAFKYGKSPCHKWAQRLRAKGKAYNLVICALARKMVTYVWHALKGHPVPGIEAPANFHRKMMRLGSRLGKTNIQSLGYPTYKAYADAICAAFWGAAPDPAPSRHTQPAHHQGEITIQQLLPPSET